ncbi:hypothetical protein GCM10007160_10080 [Litchfieldella qijiaojingensis]|uniref:Uncharacterized protein n=1 Tax=Litchfieldella qijiaojingensis TaxID=980347 RepID=A0ABQ2YHR8_9GAMM|nr:hypothetical protein [Halomonas qijiaojingensis]GGX84775.1 hypothetical protein GCM10007160_10080 [Halomonas qijiaojingensis]
MPTSLPHSDDDTHRSPLLKLLIVVTLITMVVALWYLVDYYLRGSSEDVTWYPPTKPCDLQQGPCEASLGLDARLVLDIEGELQALETLPVEVQVEGIEATAVMVEFVGRNMNMGFNRFPLTLQEEGRFRGDAQIGVCTEAVMPWRAQVIIETSDGRKGSWFDFNVRRRL